MSDLVGKQNVGFSQRSSITFMLTCPYNLQPLQVNPLLYSKTQGLQGLSRDVRKPDFCICENKAADQLCGNRTADQRLCFGYTDSTIPLLPKFQASSHLLWLYSPVCVGPGRKPPKTGFLTTRLIFLIFGINIDCEYLLKPLGTFYVLSKIRRL